MSESLKRITLKIETQGHKRLLFTKSTSETQDLRTIHVICFCYEFVNEMCFGCILI